MIHNLCDIVESLSCPADVPQPQVSPRLSCLLMAVGRVHLLLVLAMGTGQREGVLGDQVIDKHNDFLLRDGSND